MKARRKKFVSMFLAVLMLFSMFPSYIEAKTFSGHSHDGWIELTQEKLEETKKNTYNSGNNAVTVYDIGQLATGEETNMFLAEDIKLDYRIAWNKENCTLNLCLNGHLINGNSKVAFMAERGNSVLNIFDCKNEKRFFIDSDNDGCFESYAKNYDSTGKTEGKDYICTEGGTVYNSAAFIDVGDEVVVNLKDINIVGCNAVSAYSTVDNLPNLFHVCGELCISNTLIAGCAANVSIISNQGEVSILDDSRIEFNRTERSIIDNDIGNSIELCDCSIKNNIINVDETFLNYAVSCWGDEVKFLGKVIIADNYKYKDGDYPSGECEQKNLCVIDENFHDITFDGSNLSSESLIGLSLQSTFLNAGEKKEIVFDSPSADLFYSDNPLYFLEEENGKVALKNRLQEQPSKENEYVLEINEEDVDVTYQWYNATVVTPLSA